MNHTTSPAGASHDHDDPAWGWQQPHCRGQAALALFIDDLHRILQAHATNRLAAVGDLNAVQQQVDMLLAHYVGQRAAPAIFNGQTVTLKEGVDREGVSHTVPLFSPHLKQALVALLGRPGPDRA